MYRKLLCVALLMCFVNNLKAQNLVNLSEWVVGSGTISGFREIGLPSENEREWGMGPQDTHVVLWKGKPSGELLKDQGNKIERLEAK